LENRIKIKCWRFNSHTKQSNKLNFNCQLKHILNKGEVVHKRRPQSGEGFVHCGQERREVFKCGRPNFLLKNLRKLWCVHTDSSKRGNGWGSADKEEREILCGRFLGVAFNKKVIKKSYYRLDGVEVNAATLCAEGMDFKSQMSQIWHSAVNSSATNSQCLLYASTVAVALALFRKDGLRQLHTYFGVVWQLAKENIICIYCDVIALLRQEKLLRRDKLN